MSGSAPGPHPSGRSGRPRTDWEAIPKERKHRGVTSQRYDSERLTAIRYALSEGAQYPIHTHDDEQLVYVLDGRVRFAVGDEAVSLERGDLVHVPPGTPHGAAAESTEVVFLTISPQRDRVPEGRGLGPNRS